MTNTNVVRRRELVGRPMTRVVATRFNSLSAEKLI